jgi:hypothetical protein
MERNRIFCCLLRFSFLATRSAWSHYDFCDTYNCTAKSYVLSVIPRPRQTTLEVPIHLIAFFQIQSLVRGHLTFYLYQKSTIERNNLQDRICKMLLFPSQCTGSWVEERVRYYGMTSPDLQPRPPMIDTAVRYILVHPACSLAHHLLFLERTSTTSS